MAKLSGLFDSFDNLDNINIEILSSWLKNPPSPIQLENYLANKILYPTTLPQTKTDMQIDLAILREALKLNGPKSNSKEGPLLGDNPFLNITLRKIIIPSKFLFSIPNLTDLTWAFIDGLLLNRRKEDWFQDTWTVELAGDTDEIVGTILLPQFGGLGDILTINLEGKDYQIKTGSLTVLPCQRERCKVAYKFSIGKFLGKKENAVEVYGGRLGLIIDGRIQ